jgi:hypothetical protein
VAVCDLDIWRAANLLIKRHGPEAEIVAAHKVDELMAAGDVEGQLVWRCIRVAIRRWNATASKDDNVH